MDRYKMSDMKGGWFVGNFWPAAFSTPDCEVCYKKHMKDEVWDTHLHKIATEINYLIRGTMYINDTLLHEGDIFVIHPFEVSSPKFVTDCELIVVKVPSIGDDKWNI